MLAGALGAILGDSSLFWIARKSAARVQAQLDTALENPKVRAGWDAPRPLARALDRRRALRPGDALRRQRIHGSLQPSLSPLPPLVGPGRRSSGRSTRARWPTGCATTLSGFPLASLVISSLITSAALAAIYFVDRRRRRAAKGAEPTDASDGAVDPRRSSAGSDDESGSARGTSYRPRRSRPRQVHGRDGKRKKRQRTARVARGPFPGGGDETGASPRAFSPAGSPIACSCGSCRSLDRRRRARPHECGQHRGGSRDRRPSCGRRRRRSATSREPRTPTGGGFSRSAFPSCSGQATRAPKRYSSFTRSSGTSRLRGPSR